MHAGNYAKLSMCIIQRKNVVYFFISHPEQMIVSLATWKIVQLSTVLTYCYDVNYNRCKRNIRKRTILFFWTTV